MLTGAVWLLTGDVPLLTGAALFPAGGVRVSIRLAPRRRAVV